MSKYKMLILDLDGTLTNKDKIISKRNKEAIKKAIKKGVKIVLASGRPSFGIFNLARELEFDKEGGFIISYNGAKIIDFKENKIIYEKSIEKNEQKYIFDFIYRYDLDLAVIEKDDTLLTNNIDNRYLNLEAAINKLKIKEVPDIENYIKTAVPKFVLFYDKDNKKQEKVIDITKKEPWTVADYSIADKNDIEYLADKEKIIKEALIDKFEVYRSEAFFLEILPKNIDKAKSIEKLIEILNIKREETIACGDAYNDLSMIKFAGLGVAMENAVLEAKAIADYITDSNENDGVAKVIEKFILT